MSSDRHARIERMCEYCGDTFLARVERVNKGQGRFCSLNHANLFAGENSKQLRGFENGKRYWNGTYWIVRWYDVSGGQHTTSYPKWWWTLNKGEISDKYVITYKDGNPENINPSNFISMNRSEFNILRGHRGLGSPKPTNAGANNRWWRGGVSQGGYPQAFTKPLKKRIKIRDGYICQCCYSGYESASLDVHHIDRDIENNSEENLITVCKSCHRGIHGIIRKTNDRIRYFQSLLLD